MDPFPTTGQRRELQEEIHEAKVSGLYSTEPNRIADYETASLSPRK